MAVIDNFEGKIYRALIERLNTMTGGFAIVEPDETFTPDVNECHLIVTDIRNPLVDSYTGFSSADKHEGTLQVDVCAPLGWNHAQIMGVANKIRAHFPKGLNLSYGGASLFVKTTPQSLGSSYRDGSFNRLPVSINWHAQG
jgi:hypothetical protein